MANVVAPADRITLRYVPNGNKQASRELPFKALIIGNFKGNAHAELDTPVAERALANIDQRTFDIAMAEAGIQLNTQIDHYTPIKHRLSGQRTHTETRDISLSFKQLKDFNPDAIIEQVPELKTYIDLRNLLTDLKNSYGPKQRQRIMTDIITLLVSQFETKA